MDTLSRPARGTALGPPGPPVRRLRSLPANRSLRLVGLSHEGGPPVSDEEWNAFVRAEIAPRFPAGFTILLAEGHWRDAAVQARF